MTTYEHGLKTVTDLIGLHILSFIEQARERFDKTPCEALNDIAARIDDSIAAQRQKLETYSIAKDSLRSRIDAELAG